MSNVDLENRILTNEELVSLIQTGKNRADNMLALWQQCEKFVAVFDRKYTGLAEYEDLMQSGFIGLYNAVQGYEPDRGMKFISYCGFWIRREMQRCVNETRGIHIPADMGNSVQEYKKAVSKYMQKYGYEPSEREISVIMGVSREKLRQIHQTAQIGQIQSLSEPVENEDGEMSLEECIASPENLEEATVKAMDAEEMKRELWLAVDNLPEEEATIIYNVYLDDMTRAAAGKAIGVSQSKARALENRALQTLRRSHKTKYRRYSEEYISAAPISHTGLKSFKTTWWSGTERLAIKD